MVQPVWRQRRLRGRRLTLRFNSTAWLRVVCITGFAKRMVSHWAGPIHVLQASSVYVACTWLQFRFGLIGFRFSWSRTHWLIDHHVTARPCLVDTQLVGWRFGLSGRTCSHFDLVRIRSPLGHSSTSVLPIDMRTHTVMTHIHSLQSTLIHSISNCYYACNMHVRCSPIVDNAAELVIKQAIETRSIEHCASSQQCRHEQHIARFVFCPKLLKTRLDGETLFVVPQCQPRDVDTQQHGQLNQ